MFHFGSLSGFINSTVRMMTSRAGGAAYTSKTSGAGKTHMRLIGGDIEINEAGEGADLSTKGGDVRVGKAGKDLRLRTMGGNISVGPAVNVDAQTMGGDIEIGPASGSVKACSLGGNVVVQIISDETGKRRDIRLSSIGGRVELTAPKDFSMTLDVTLTFTQKNEGKYSVTSDLDLQFSAGKEWDKSHGDPQKHITARTRVGDGRHHVTLETIDGDIIINRA